MKAEWILWGIVVLFLLLSIVALTTGGLATQSNKILFFTLFAIGWLSIVPALIVGGLKNEKPKKKAQMRKR